MLIFVVLLKQCRFTLNWGQQYKFCNIIMATSIFSNIQISNEIQVKEYKLMYLFGAWISKCSICAECDEEAIFDADDAFASSRLKEWKNGVALFCGNRMVKKYI